MRALRFHEHGGPEVLRFEAVPVPDPGPGEVRIRHEAIGLNYIDVYHRTGLYPVASLPSGLGLEAAGEVTAVGPGVEGFAVGDKVAYAGGPLGACAEERVFPAERLVHRPGAVAADVAAAVLLKGMTAEFLIHRTFEVQPGQTVLFHAAAGGVGLLACQWLKAKGARVIGTVGSEAKAALARAAGCDEVILYTKEDFVARTRALTGGQGVPVVYDSVGRDTFHRSLDCLAPRGLLVGFGNASGKPDPLDVGSLAVKGSLFVTRATLFTYTASRADLELSAGRVFDAVARGTLRPHIGQRFPLADAAQAYRALEGRGTTGSTLLLP